FKSVVGLDGITEVPRGQSLCAAALPADGVTEIEDIWSDRRFASNPIVAGATEMRFFAGAPLRLRGGQRIGALCVLDRHPRRLDDDQRASLVDLAQIAARFLESRQVTVDAVAD